jgi:Fe-S cluster biogenesis protein NfuA
MNMDTVQIKTQRTPNPNAWKYILSVDVKTVGKVSYTDESECRHIPLAVALLRMANVTQVHFFENVITVTQNGASDWGVLDGAVQFAIKGNIANHDPNFMDSLAPDKESLRANHTPEMLRIEEILDREIRPGLQADGGDLELVELDGNILTIKYQGACGGCPSAMMGTLQAIEMILRNEHNPYLEVVAI